MISAEGGSSTQQRKRQRLDQLVDRIAHFVSSSQASVRDKHVSETCLSATATMSRFHFRCPSRQNQVFNFDHVVLPSDRSDEEAEEDVFSPLATFSDRLTLSPCGSSADSPGISFSPLSLDDDRHHSGPLNLSKSSAHVISPPFITSSPIYTRGVRVGSSVLSDFRRRARSDSDLHETLSLEYPSTVTPWIVTPAPFPQIPIQFPRSSRLEHLRPPPLTVSVKRSSTDSDSSSPLLQESPVDLSVRSGSSASSDSTNQSTLSGEYPGRTPVISRSLGTRPKLLTRSLSLTQHLTSSDFSNDSIGDDSTMGPPKPPFTCEVCGQVFDLHDRLVKHLASRHRSKQRALPEGAVAKGYQCDVCQRSFARSDMLTRHMRLHTGLKPYTCRICGQVFSRSDHLSTHQRTHTGEKPYRCPQCAYAACRRDMITRHLRTHMRSEDLDDSSRRKDCV